MKFGWMDGLSLLMDPLPLAMSWSESLKAASTALSESIPSIFCRDFPDSSDGWISLAMIFEGICLLSMNFVEWNQRLIYLLVI